MDFTGLSRQVSHMASNRARQGFKCNLKPFKKVHHGLDSVTYNSIHPTEPECHRSSDHKCHIQVNCIKRKFRQHEALFWKDVYCNLRVRKAILPYHAYSPSNINLKPMWRNKKRPSASFVSLALIMLSCRVLADELTGVEIAARTDEATVLIATGDSRLTELGQGSGFFVTPNLIVTNFHVIEDASIIAYKRVGQVQVHAIKSVRDVDATYDLAILEVPSTQVLPLYIGDSSSVRKGETVYVAGNPHGFEGTFSDGTLSAIRRDFNIDLLQITAPISSGSSGGPVLNAKAEVIGVASSAFVTDDAQNLNFAIPSNYLKGMLQTLGVRLRPKPESYTGRKERDKEERDSTALEIPNAKKAKPEAEKGESDTEQANMEAKRTDDERAKTEAEMPMWSKEEVTHPKKPIVNRLQAATVHIYGQDRNGTQGRLGTGFFVRPNQVATDFHVIDGSTLSEVKPVGRGSHYADESLVAHFLKSDKARNLALIRVETAFAQPLPIGNSDKIQEDDKIRVFSNSSDSTGEFSEGTISSTRFIGDVQYFEIDALVEPGSAGGPIVNGSGEVVAVTALKVPILDGSFKFAIPSKYLIQLLEAKGDLASTPSPSPELKVFPKPDSYADASPYGEWLLSGIERYEQAQFAKAIRLLESALDGLTHPENRAKAHLYLGCSRWGRGDSQESTIAEFQEALSHDPNIELPPHVGQNHPIFSPLLEKTRQQTTGTLTVNASPPHTQIEIIGSRTQIIKEGVGSVNHCRLFKGDYTVKCTVGEASDLKTISIVPGVHYLLDREIAETPTSASRELTVELDRAAKPQRVEVHYEIYDPSGQVIDRGVLQMQLRGEKPETGTWVYHVKWPRSTPAGRLEHRIKVDGKDILPNPPPGIVILEPSDDAWVFTNHSITLKAAITSDIPLKEVFVHYNEASMELKKTGTPDTYAGTIPGRDVRAAGTFWYFVTATDAEEKKSRSEVRSVVIRRRVDSTIIDVIPPPEVSVLAPPGAAVLPTRNPISIEAEVKSRAPLKEVRVHFDFPRSQLSETSPSEVLEKTSSGTYIAEIPNEHNQSEGYVWYFVAATTGSGVVSKTEDRMVETKEPTIQVHQGVWASHSWSNLVSDDGIYSGWERGDVLSLAFMREGRGFQTLGAQLDYTYENRDYISAMVQWGPSTRENPVAFAFLGGITGYRRSDTSFSRTRQPTEITPILGGSMKFFPLDRVTVDLTASMKLQSEIREANRESNFANDFLHHYEMEIRLYMSPSLNFKAGYGIWRLGGYDNTSVRVGLGATF